MAAYRFLAGLARRLGASFLTFVVFVLGCKESTGNLTEKDERPTRGDRVVVEPRAAEFFEGRVLSVSKGELRVQPTGGGDPMSVSVADVYPVPVRPGSPRPGQILVCRVEARWVGCRAERRVDSEWMVRVATGDVARISPDSTFVPSPLTELNIERLFERSVERARFREASQRAGEPQRPTGFRLLPRARVVARRGAAWYGGVVHELDDHGAYIMFDSDGMREHVSSADVVPEPPYPGHSVHGAFALARPQSPADPWSPVRILGARVADFGVADETGEERVLAERDLLPLGSP